MREVPESGELKNRGEVLQSKMVDGVGGVVNGGGGVGDSGGGAALRGRTKSRVAKLVLSGLEEAPEVSAVVIYNTTSLCCCCCHH